MGSIPVMPTTTAVLHGCTYIFLPIIILLQCIFASGKRLPLRRDDKLRSWMCLPSMYCLGKWPSGEGGTLLKYLVIIYFDGFDSHFTYKVIYRNSLVVER